MQPPRRNPDYEKIEDGEPVVSDRIIDNQQRFVPFTVRRGHDPNYTHCPLGGYLSLEVCFPYGDLAGGYADHKPRH